MASKKPLEIDMIAGSQLRDTQGEMLSVDGADISDLQAGRGRLNDNHGKGFFNSIGKVTGAKKIFKEEDCDNDRQKYYWNKVKAPFIYVKGYLYDDEDHPNARAAAAILRNIHKSDSPLQLKASVEGGVVARGIADSSLLARTKIHSVALTFTPANNNTLVEPISLNKTDYDEVSDMELIKSVMHLAETNVPSFRHIVRDASATKVQNNLSKLVELMRELGIEGEIHIPSKQQILQKALEQKIESNVMKIKELVSVLKDGGDLEKGMKNAIAGALTAAAISSTPSSISEDTISSSKPKVESKVAKKTHKDVFNDISKRNPLLAAIGHIESSGADNIGHKTIDNKSSMHHGHTAGGPFGMMPHAAAFIIKKDPKLAQKYPHLKEAAQDIGANHEKFTEAMNSDPELAGDFAEALFNRNKSKTKSESQLVYSWLNGLKGSWNKFKEGGEEAINSHPYVQKVISKYSEISPKREIAQENKDLTKALTAGYGGASSPSDRVSGSVIQAEVIDKPGFKYITCDQCGKEQVHAKYQVKCRNCGHGLSFAKLEAVIRGIR